jgi:3-oxoacyl-[acyl-carrier-protein] synthase II
MSRFPAEDLPALAQCDYGRVTLNLTELLGGKGWRHFTRAGLMACLVGRHLLARVETTSSAPIDELTGISLGYSHDIFIPSFYSAFMEKDLRLINPPLFLNLSTNAPASQISILLKFHGPIFTHTTGFTAGLEALDTAAMMLRGGHAERMFAGAVQEINEELAESFHQVRWTNTPQTLTSPTTGGIIAGEGCALLALEKNPESRNVLAWLRGFGQGFNPAPGEPGDPTAAQQAIQGALHQSGLTPAEIGAVFLAASGDACLDAAEGKALETVFSSQVPPSVALKGAWGECYHAGGAMAAAMAVLALEQQCLPPTLNLAQPEVKRLGLSSAIQKINARYALIMAMDRDQKAAALILEASGKRPAC